MDNSFLIASVTLTIINLLLHCLSTRQVIHDVMRRERFRAWTLSHYLVFAASWIVLVVGIDSQGGLGIYSIPFSGFLVNFRSVVMLGAAFCLAAAFIDSHKLMTVGPAKGVPKAMIIHTTLLTLGVILFLVLAITRYTWLRVAAKAFQSVYSFIAVGHVLFTASRVRQILVDENKRTGNYVEGIRKLTRFMIVLAALVIPGNIPYFWGIAIYANLARTQLFLKDSDPKFSPYLVLGDVIAFISIGVLLLGGWKTASKESNSPPKTQTTSLQTSPSSDVRVNRSSTIKSTLLELAIVPVKHQSRGESQSGMNPELTLRIEKEFNTNELMLDNVSREASHEEKLQTILIDAAAAANTSSSDQQS